MPRNKLSAIAIAITKITKILEVVAMVQKAKEGGGDSRCGGPKAPTHLRWQMVLTMLPWITYSTKLTPFVYFLHFHTASTTCHLIHPSYIGFNT